MSGMMSLLHIVSRLILAYLVFGIYISTLHLSSLLAFLCLLHWSYIWHIDIDVLGFVWWFRQSFVTIHPMCPITRRNVIFVCATSQLEIKQQVPNHVSASTTEGVLPAPCVAPVHTSSVDASLQIQTIEGDIQTIGQGCSVLVFFFLVTVFFFFVTYRC